MVSAPERERFYVTSIGGYSEDGKPGHWLTCGYTTGSIATTTWTRLPLFPVARRMARTAAKVPA